MYYPEFRAIKKAVHTLYKSARAGSLASLAEDCASFAVNKELAFVAHRDARR
jgi:hypothetical protein